MSDIYKNKNVLSIGARKGVLTKFSEALIQEGFKAVWTNNHKKAAEVLKVFDPAQLDVVAFGRGVSTENKAIFRNEFKAKNPSIEFVDGLAPITNLLVDQIKSACKPDAQNKVGINIQSDGELEIGPVTSGRWKIKHYRLNWLFQSNEKVIFDQPIDAETLKVPFKKKSGSNFIVIMRDELVMNIKKIF